MRTIIAVRGVANRGKSTSIKLAYQLLKDKYPNAKINEIFIGADISVIMTIGSIKIGIESQGDPNSRLFKSLKLFVEEGCKAIICATRSSGHTVEEVEKFANRYQIRWFDKSNEPNTEQQEAANIAMVEEIFAAVQAAIKE